MKRQFLKALLLVGVMTACACMLFACGGANKSGGGVAATVNGTEIAEDEVTNTIQNVRAQSNLEDEDSWGNFLVSNDMTPESIREQIINSMIDKELVKTGATELGVTVDSAEVEKYVQSMKANFDSDKAWEEALTQAGFTDESYRQSIEQSLTQQAINKHFEDAAEVTDDDILEAAKTYAPYYDGAKRSSHILIGVDDVNDKKAMKEAREKAQGIADRIKNGEISFEDAAKEYSTDKGSAEKGGDVGWDVLNSFVNEYTDALDGLEKGEISDPVDSQYGVHIITVTDVYKAPDEVKSLKDLPAEFHDTIKDYAKSLKSNDAYTTWLKEQRDKADITINPMPENVPYNIDLTKYKEAAEAEGSDESSEVTIDDASAESEDSANSAGTESESSSSASAESASASSASADAESASSASAESEGA